VKISRGNSIEKSYLHNREHSPNFKITKVTNTENNQNIYGTKIFESNEILKSRDNENIEHFKVEIIDKMIEELQTLKTIILKEENRLNM